MPPAVRWLGPGGCELLPWPAHLTQLTLDDMLWRLSLSRSISKLYVTTLLAIHDLLGSQGGGAVGETERNAVSTALSALRNLGLMGGPGAAKDEAQQVGVYHGQQPCNSSALLTMVSTCLRAAATVPAVCPARGLLGGA
jgi:hypothetical protein